MRDKELYKSLSRTKFDLEYPKWDAVQPDAVQSLYIVPYYTDPNANTQTKKTIEEQTSAALYWALKYKLDGDQASAQRAVNHLTKWALTNNELRNFEAKVSMVVEGNKFIQACLYLDDFDWNKDIFGIWVRDIYSPAADRLLKTKVNNLGAWGWLGWLRSERLLNNPVAHYHSLILQHFNEAVNSQGVMIHEVLRTNSGMWYVNYALEAYTQIFFDFVNFDDINLFSVLEKTLDWYFQFCLKPETWPFKLPNNPILRWITKKMYPCSDTVELPKPYDWPAHILDLLSVYTFDKPKWEEWIQRPIHQQGLNIYKYSTLLWSHDICP